MNDRDPWAKPVLWVLFGLCAITGVGSAVTLGDVPWGQLGGATATGATLFGLYFPEPVENRATMKRRLVIVVSMVALGVGLAILTRPLLDDNPALDWTVAVLMYGGYAIYLPVSYWMRRKRAGAHVLTDHSPADRFA